MAESFHTILVPHDLSAHASRALALAALLVGRQGRLVVLHVVERYGNRLVQRRVASDARRALARVVARAGRAPGAPRIMARVVVGDPYRKICRATRGADCIVMCTAGRTGLRHLVMGSVAEKVVRHAAIPVLTFRPEVRLRKRPFRSVLVPHDFSAPAGRALRFAAGLVGPRGRLRVLTVVGLPPEVGPRMAKRVVAADRARLASLVARTVGAGGPRVAVGVEIGDPYLRVVRAGRGVDAIVMGTVGRTGLPHLVIGSVAEKVVRHARVPVLTIREPRARRSSSARR
jgi:nucleotide-binding universal stress UspA family protein